MKEARDPIACMIIELGIRRNEDILITIYPAVGMAGLLARCVKYIGYDGVGFPKRPVAYRCRFRSYRILDLPEIP